MTTPKTKKEVEAMRKKIKKLLWDNSYGDWNNGNLPEKVYKKYDEYPDFLADKILTLLNPVEKDKYPIYKSSCCGVGVSAEGMGEAFYYKCNKCGKDCDFIPSPNEAQKGEAKFGFDIGKDEGTTFTMTEICPKCGKPTSIRHTTEAEEMKKMLDSKQTLTVSPLCKDCQPPAPDKEWEELYTTVAIFLDNLNIRDDFPIIVTHKTYKVNDLDSLMKIFLDWLRKHDKALFLSKDQEADRRVEEVIGIVDNYFATKRFASTDIRTNEAVQFQLRVIYNELKKKLSLSHKEERKV